MTACKRKYTLLCILTLLKPISFRCTQNAFKTLQRSSLLQVEAMHTVGTGLHRECRKGCLTLGVTGRTHGC